MMLMALAASKHKGRSQWTRSLFRFLCCPSFLALLPLILPPFTSPLSTSCSLLLVKSSCVFMLMRIALLQFALQVRGP